MIFIWGSSSLELKESYSLSLNCNSCNNNEFLLHGIQNYSHFWYVFMFSGEKQYFLTCTNCLGSISYNNLKELGPEVEKLKFDTPKIFNVSKWILISIISLFFVCAFIF